MGFGQIALARDLALPSQVDPLLPMRGMAAGSSLLGLLTGQAQQARMAPLELQAAQQQNQMRGLQIQQAQSEMRDRQLIMGSLQRNQGNMGAVLKDPNVYGQVNPDTYMNLQAEHAKMLDVMGQQEDRELQVQRDRNSRRAALLFDAERLGPEAYARNAGAISAAYNGIGNDENLAPNTPFAALHDLAMQHATLDSYLKQEDDRRQQQQFEEAARHNRATEQNQANKPEKLSDVEQYTQDYLAAHGLPETPANRLLAHQAFTNETKTQPGVARLNVLLQRPTEVGDPNNPGETIMVPQAQAAGMPGRSSASVQNPRAMGRYMTSGAGGAQLTAFSTAIKHLGTLDRLADDLGNTDIQIFNRAKQAWAQQTGNPAPVNFKAAVAAMSGEVASAFKKSGATDQEIGEVRGVLDKAQSPAQLHDAIETVRGLLYSKRDVLRGQYQQGMKGQPNFGDNTGAAADPSDPLGILPRRR